MFLGFGNHEPVRRGALGSVENHTPDSMARTIILKLAVGGHCGQGARALQNFLV